MQLLGLTTVRHNDRRLDLVDRAGGHVVAGAVPRVDVSRPLTCWSMRLGDDAYYDDGGVLHTQQGDIYAEIPFVLADATGDRPAPRGQRKRFRLGTTPDYAVPPPYVGLGVVCSYTCGFLAQPPGVEGYAHDCRVVAPVVPLRYLADSGYDNRELRRVEATGGTHGLMYVPLPTDDPADDEWTGHAAICLFRPSLVTQGLLDARDRVARLSDGGQRVLMSRLAQVFSSHVPDPFDPAFPGPDRTDGWTPPPSA